MSCRSLVGGIGANSARTLPADYQQRHLALTEEVVRQIMWYKHELCVFSIIILSCWCWVWGLLYNVDIEEKHMKEFKLQVHLRTIRFRVYSNRHGFSGFPKSSINFIWEIVQSQYSRLSNEKRKMSSLLSSAVLASFRLIYHTCSECFRWCSQERDLWCTVDHRRSHEVSDSHQCFDHLLRALAKGHWTPAEETVAVQQFAETLARCCTTPCDETTSMKSIQC